MKVHLLFGVVDTVALNLTPLQMMDVRHQTIILFKKIYKKNFSHELDISTCSNEEKDKVCPLCIQAFEILLNVN